MYCNLTYECVSLMDNLLEPNPYVVDGHISPLLICGKIIDLRKEMELVLHMEMKSVLHMGLELELVPFWEMNVVLHMGT